MRFVLNQILIEKGRSIRDLTMLLITFLNWATGKVMQCGLSKLFNIFPALKVSPHSPTSSTIPKAETEKLF